MINAVIGFPLEHSMSPRLHNLVYTDFGIDAQMIKIAGENVKELVEMIRKKPIHLTAVTMPHKETIIPLLDEVDEEAEEIGAVNTIINQGGRLYGYNTDIIGIEFALRELDFKDKKVLIIGAGGAAKPVGHFVSKKMGALFYLNRTKEKAEALAEKYGGKIITKDEIPQDTFLIVNATPLGMHPHEDESPLDEVPENATVFDLIYNPQETKLMKSAKNSISGLDMFVAQGLAQIHRWSGKNPDPSKYINQLKNEKTTSY